MPRFLQQKGILSLPQTFPPPSPPLRVVVRITGHVYKVSGMLSQAATVILSLFPPCLCWSVIFQSDAWGGQQCGGAE